MALKTFWIKILRVISFKYKLFENFFPPGNRRFVFEFSKSSLIVINVLIKTNFQGFFSQRFFFTGNLIVLKSGVGLLYLRGLLFKVQNLKFKTKKNLMNLMKKYSSALNLSVLNNYFKILFLSVF